MKKNIKTIDVTIDGIDVTIELNRVVSVIDMNNVFGTLDRLQGIFNGDITPTTITGIVREIKRKYTELTVLYTSEINNHESFIILSDDIAELMEGKHVFKLRTQKPNFSFIIGTGGRQVVKTLNKIKSIVGLESLSRLEVIETDQYAIVKV